MLTRLTDLTVCKMKMSVGADLLGTRTGPDYPPVDILGRRQESISALVHVKVLKGTFCVLTKADIFTCVFVKEDKLLRNNGDL